MTILQAMSTDSLANILMHLLAEEKLALGCKICDKDPASYSHLDRGRQAMMGGNLLRNLLKKDITALARIADEAARIIAARDPSVVVETKKASTKN